MKIESIKIDPCPYCRSKYLTTHVHDIPWMCIHCRDCKTSGPHGNTEIDAAYKWNWLSKAVGERDYYREKVIQFEIEHKDCNR